MHDFRSLGRRGIALAAAGCTGVLFVLNLSGDIAAASRSSSARPASAQSGGRSWATGFGVSRHLRIMI